MKTKWRTSDLVNILFSCYFLYWLWCMMPNWGSSVLHNPNFNASGFQYPYSLAQNCCFMNVTDFVVFLFIRKWTKREYLVTRNYIPSTTAQYDSNKSQKCFGGAGNALGDRRLWWGQAVDGEHCMSWVSGAGCSTKGLRLLYLKTISLKVTHRLCSSFLLSLPESEVYCRVIS